MRLKELVSAAFTLVAATDKELLTAAGLDLTGMDRVSILLKNTGGSNALDGFAAYWCCDNGTVWSPADSSAALPGGTLAAGGTVTMTWVPPLGRRLRIVVSSTSGTTASLSLLAQGPT